MFVKEGEKSIETNEIEQSNILHSVKDWRLSVDLDERLRILAEITITNLRPDITLISEETKQFIMIKLTVTTEERIEVSGELKKTKYILIVEEGRQKGWLGC